MKRVIDDVRNQTITDIVVGRVSLVNRKDLHNIKRDFDDEYHRHKLDSVSVQLWVDEIANDPNDSVVYFKEQAEEDTSGLVEKNYFVLIIMYRKEMLKTYGEDKLCVDGTHGQNPYDFILHSLLVVGDFGNGSPAAFCFSNGSNEAVLSLYFTQVRSQVGQMKSHVFMSDHPPAYYNAWQNVMGSIPNQLLCSWHVTKNWMENLAKIKSSEKKKMVLKIIKTVRNELSTENFQEMFSKTIRDLQTDEDTKDFRQYLLENYADRPEKWAYYFRARLVIRESLLADSQLVVNVLTEFDYYY